MKRKYIYLLIALTVLAFMIVVVLLNNRQAKNNIHSFEDCAKAGYPIIETYPEQCNANGVNYVNRQ